MNEVRIIGGMLRRRKLTFPPRPGVRPTPDRTRVTLFNWLTGYLEGAACLDLFAGSGVLGFEAASRGAAAVTMVDRDPAVVAALELNRVKLGATICEVIRGESLHWLDADTRRWDIVFLDPPFDGVELAGALSLLATGSHVHRDSWVYVEHRLGAPPPLDGWAVEKSTRAGASTALMVRLV